LHKLFTAWVESLKAPKVLGFVDITKLVKFHPVLIFLVSWKAQKFSVHDAMIEVRLKVLRIHCFAFSRYTKEPNGIPDQLTLDFFIEWAVRREAGAVVDFEEVRLAFVVQHDIEAEDLKAHRVLEVVYLTGAHSIGNLWLPSDKRLHNNVFDTLHQFLRVLSLTFLQVLEGEFEAALMANRVNNCGPIRLKFV